MEAISISELSDRMNNVEMEDADVIDMSEVSDADILEEVTRRKLAIQTLPMLLNELPTTTFSNEQQALHDLFVVLGDVAPGDLEGALENIDGSSNRSHAEKLTSFILTKPDKGQVLNQSHNKTFELARRVSEKKAAFEQGLTQAVYELITRFVASQSVPEPKARSQTVIKQQLKPKVVKPATPQHKLITNKLLK